MVLVPPPCLSCSPCKPLDMSAKTTNSSICHICGSTGAQIHYRAMACGSCKVFFVRAVARPVPFVCDNNGRCTVTKERRNSCKACRFMCCLKANMSEKDIGRLKKNTSSGKNDSVVPYLSADDIEVKVNEIYEETSIGSHFAQSLEKTAKASDYAKLLVHIERFCDNPHATRSTFEYSLDLSLAEVLRKPQLCCSRTPMGWNQDQFVEPENLLDILKQIYCRTVTMFADFASVCPELTLLEEKDRLAVCSTNYCGVVLFTMVYNAYVNNCNGILFPHGFKYSLSQKKDDDEFNEFLQNLVDYLHRHVVCVFRDSRIDTAEYSLLKSLILFSGVLPLTDAGMEIVLRARRKYAALLADFVAATRVDLTQEEQMKRLTQLYSIVPHMMELCIKQHYYCAGIVGSWCEIGGSLQNCCNRWSLREKNYTLATA